MTTNRPRFYDALRTDRDDQNRAAVFDAWLMTQPEDVRNQCTYWLACLEESYTPTTARVLLATLFCFVTAKPTDQDRMIRHGEALQAAREWEQIAARKFMPVQMAEV